VILFVEPQALWHVALAMMLNWACNKDDDVDPPDDVLPHPDTIAVPPEAGSEPEAARVTVAALVPGEKLDARTRTETS